MVDRYTPNKIANAIMADEAWHDSKWVRASDYDALAARLAEAERHIRNLYKMSHGEFPDDHPFTLSNVAKFLAVPETVPGSEP